MAGLAMLHTRGVLAAGVDRSRRTGPLPRDAEPLERALYAALYGSVGPREFASQKRVQRALRDVRHGLIERGLVRTTSRRVLMPVLLVTPLPAVLPRLVAAEVVGVTEGLMAVVALVGIAVWMRRRRGAGVGCRPASIRRPHRQAPVGPAEVGFAVALFGAPAQHA
jgi:uncharacterized protein (TIGR04222 family)